MKTRETKRGTIFEFTNRFMKYRISKNDKKLNSFLRFKYNLIKKLNLQERMKKGSWFWLMNHHWNEDIELSPNANDKEIKLTSNDLELQQIIVYDLLPKEYLEDYKNKYLKFVNDFKGNYPFTRTRKDIQKSFNDMENSAVTGSWYNIDHFRIKETTSLSKYFYGFSLSAIGLSESFYIIKYTLNVTVLANQELETILQFVVYKEPICLSCDRWWKKKSFAGCSIYDIGSEAKRHAIDDFILNLKAIFFQEIKKYIFSKFFDWDKIPPSIEIYSSKTLDSKEKEILEIVSRHGNLTVNLQEKEKIFFIPFRAERHWESLNNSKFIVDSQQFNDDHGFYSFYKYDELICTQFAEYFVLTALATPVAKKIYSAQRKINKNIYSNSRLNSIIKLKTSIEKDLYYYKRLYKELNKMVDDKTKNNRELSIFNKEFTSEHKKIHGKSSPYDFDIEYKSCFYGLKAKFELMQSIFAHFDDNSKLIESRYNYSIVKWTLIVGSLTLLATILLANDSNILNSILDFIKKFF